MNVYAEHYRIQEYLQSVTMNNVTVVTDKALADYIITGQYTHDKHTENLQGIIIPYTGHNRINLNHMRDDKLQLFILPTRSRWVAEKAVTLTLASLGRTIPYHTQLKQGNWSARNSEKRIPWASIQDRSVGLFGYGRIGKKIHQFLSGFGCDFYTIDRGKIYPEGIKTVKNLTNLIQLSDIIIISAPLNETTEGIFDSSQLKRMKHKYLINVGRGKIIEEEALYNALQNNILAGFASDVWYTYPKGKEPQNPSSYPIHEFDNVVLSNHSGGFTEDTNETVNKDLVKLLENIAAGNTSMQLDLATLR